MATFEPPQAFLPSRLLALRWFGANYGNSCCAFMVQNEDKEGKQIAKVRMYQLIMDTKKALGHKNLPAMIVCVPREVLAY